jgi:hypothetical protein
MIALASDFLIFRTVSGDSVPFSAEMISVEFMGDSAELFDAEFVRDAAHAVFHYFQSDLGRQTVSVGEFAEALEKVLRGFSPAARLPTPQASALSSESGSDLNRLAREFGPGSELFFFPSLRNELRRQLSQSPRVLRFHGLRDCVKELIGTRRWTPRCRRLAERIVEYLQQCVGAEDRQANLALVVK